MKEIIQRRQSLRIDYREQRSGIEDALKNFSDEVTYEFCNLQTGDYWIEDKIIIERKTLSDFLNSIKTGRIFQQAYRMANSGKNNLLILEGDKSEV